MVPPPHKKLATVHGNGTQITSADNAGLSPTVEEPCPPKSLAAGPASDYILGFFSASGKTLTSINSRPLSTRTSVLPANTPLLSDVECLWISPLSGPNRSSLDPFIFLGPSTKLWLRNCNRASTVLKTFLRWKGKTLLPSCWSMSGAS